MSDIKVGDRVSHSGEPGAYGTVEEVDHSCFGTCVLVRYDDGKIGYHRESRLVLEDCMYSKRVNPAHKCSVGSNTITDEERLDWLANYPINALEIFGSLRNPDDVRYYIDKYLLVDNGEEQ